MKTTDSEHTNAGTDRAVRCPDGWFAIAFSDEVRPGRLLTTRLGDQELVVYRTRKGLPRVVRPHCAHLGAHLGHGGRVEAEDIVCPYHGFAFGPDGACVRTPYGTPPRASLNVLPLRELHGLLWVWHHADGAPPAWEPVSVSEDGFTGRALLRRSFRGHQHDFVENIVDVGHFTPVHHARTVLGEVVADGPYLRGEETLDGFHNFSFTKNIRAHLEFQCGGLGQVVAVFSLPALGRRFLQVAGLTPDERGELCIRVVTSSDTGMPGARLLAPLVSRLINAATLVQFRADFPIWANRRFIEHPKLAAEDGPIMLTRRWAQQFYSSERTGSHPAAQR